MYGLLKFMFLSFTTFQVLSTRKRKDATESEIKVPVCVFMFDLLYLNGESLVKEKFIDRRRLLRENFKEVPGEWMFAASIDSSKMEDVSRTNSLIEY